jgi:hypothetical protein
VLTLGSEMRATVAQKGRYRAYQPPFAARKPLGVPTSGARFHIARFGSNALQRVSYRSSLGHLVMVGEIFAGIGAFKAMFDTAKAMIDINDTARRNSASIELQAQILAAQQAQFTLIERVRDLEKEVAHFEAWETEKQRYQLNNLDAGAMAYVYKSDANGTKAPHWACTNCFHQAKVSILQPLVTSVSMAGRHGRIWNCPLCSTKIDVPWAISPDSIK